MNRGLALALAGGRVAFGLGVLVAPRLASVWVQDEAAHPRAQVVIRGLGARDAALGALMIRAVLGGGDVRSVAAASAAADLTDLVATLLAGDVLSREARIGNGLVAAGAAVGGAALAVTWDE